MTVLESDINEGGAKEPIKFPGTKEERREAREARARRRLERKSAEPAEETIAPVPFIEPEELPRYEPLQPVADEPAKEKRGFVRHRLQISWTYLSFLLMVAIPGAATGFYYAFIASPQYVIETQFSVRGSSQASMSSFGLSGLFGNSTQSSDSYIVASYIDSVQLIRDVKEQLGIDLRQYYAKNNIDFWYRIDPNMPLEKFTDYWQDMIEVSYNSTTGNTTLYIYGFSPDDAKAIADAVLKVSETLVNDLSEKNRQQMTMLASKQVDRSEERLRKVREEIQKLRSKEKTVDPVALVKSNVELTQKLEGEFQDLKTRYDTLLQSVDKDSPQAKVMRKQMRSIQDMILKLKLKIGTSSDAEKSAASKDDAQPGQTTNIAEVANKFEQLDVEDKFATQAYTTSLAAFETALAEAQKQERYFATFIAPMRPEIALYPKRLLDTFIAVLVLCAVWMISQFLYRSFRDHAI
jgi:capsular polysaccharide transport system permease protein